MFYQFLLALHCAFALYAIMQLVIVFRKIRDQHRSQFKSHSRTNRDFPNRLQRRHSFDSATAVTDPGGSSLSHTNTNPTLVVLPATVAGAESTAQRESPMPPPTRLTRWQSSGSYSSSSIMLVPCVNSLSLWISSLLSNLYECISCARMLRKGRELRWRLSELHGVTPLVMTTNLLVLLLCLLTVFHSIVFVMSLSNLINCRQQMYLGPVAYQICKSDMYIIFLLRIQTMVHRSSFAYSKTLMRSLFAIIAVGSMVLCVVMPFSFNVGERVVFSHSGIQRCRIEASPLIGVSVVLFDLIMSVTCLHLFTKPLRRLSEMDSSHGRRIPAALSLAVDRNGSGNGSNSSLPIVSELNVSSVTVALPQQQTNYGSMMQQLASKFRLLTWTAILSTLINIVFNVTLHFNYGVVLDLIVTDLCVIFMAAWFDDYYAYVCCLPLWIEGALKRVFSAVMSPCQSNVSSN